MNENRRRAYTAREVGEVINANLYTVHILLRTGKLRGFKINTHWRIMPDALEEFMQRKGGEGEIHGDARLDV